MAQESGRTRLAAKRQLASDISLANKGELNPDQFGAFRAFEEVYRSDIERLGDRVVGFARAWRRQGLSLVWCPRQSAAHVHGLGDIEKARDAVVEIDKIGQCAPICARQSSN
jgi:hypothetical protein